MLLFKDNFGYYFCVNIEKDDLIAKYRNIKYRNDKIIWKKINKRVLLLIKNTKISITLLPHATTYIFALKLHPQNQYLAFFAYV